MGRSASSHNQSNKYYKDAEALIAKFPRVYLVFACLVALSGYALVILPPLLIVTASYNIYGALSTGVIANWLPALIWLIVLIVSALFSYRGSQINITPPAGLTALEEKLPRIFKLVQEYQDYFKRPEIQRIVITANYELDIVKVPVFNLPVWSTNTMVIGLPVLLCHSPKHFECMMARRLGQFSKNQNPVTNWLYQLRAIWKQYSLAYNKLKTPDSYILKWIYAKFTALYDITSVYAARNDELNADTYAMEFFINEDVRQMITADMTYHWFLREHYWPAITELAFKKTKQPLTPYKNMAATITSNLKEEKLKFLINKVFTATPDNETPTPSMLQRLENVGHDTPSLEENAGDSAALKYLGDSLSNVVNLIDKLWLNDIMKQQRLAKKQKS